MANFTYLKYTDNKGSASATTITASTAATAYPASNLKTLPIAKHWRSTGITSEDLQLDLGSALSIDLFGLINHNITASGTITVNGGSSANPDGSQYTTTVTRSEFDAFKLLSTAETWRYWKFIFADTTNPDGYIKVGKLLLGDSTTLAFHWQYGSKFTDRFVNIFKRSGGGVPYYEPVYGLVSQVFSFGPLTVAEMVTLRTLYRDLQGSANPLFIIPESGASGSSGGGYFGRFANEMVRTLNYQEYCDLEFESDGRGRDITA